MPENSEVAFERTVAGEEAIVLSKGLENLDNPKFLDLLRKTGVPPTLFGKLIHGQCDWLKPPTDQEFFSNGKKLEDIKLGIASTELGPIEVSEVTFHPEAVKPDDIALHLKQPTHRGFEAILVLEGKASLYLPDSTNPVGTGIYVRSKNGTNVDLNEGDLTFIPAPTANGWLKATEGFRFRYVCLPPWHSNFVVPTF